MKRQETHQNQPAAFSHKCSEIGSHLQATGVQPMFESKDSETTFVVVNGKLESVSSQRK